MAARGARVAYHDPYVRTAELSGGAQRSVPLTPARLRRSACVVVLTNHSNVDYEAVLRHAPIIVDTRNQFGALARRPRHVITL